MVGLDRVLRMGAMRPVRRRADVLQSAVALRGYTWELTPNRTRKPLSIRRHAWRRGPRRSRSGVGSAGPRLLGRGRVVQHLDVGAASDLGTHRAGVGLTGERPE